MSQNTMRVRYRLPTSYNIEIGRFITRWAYLEWMVSEILYSLMGVDPKIGRLAVREPPIEARLTLVQKTAGLQKVAVSVNWKKLKSTLQEMADFRNKLAHGIWLDDPNTPHPAVRQVTGSYTPKQGGKSYDAKIHPASLPVPLYELRNAVAGIDHANRMVHAIKKQIEAQLPPSP